MPKMRGFLRTKEKIDDAEWAIAQIRTAARLEDLFSPNEGQAAKQAEATASATDEAAPILVGPGPWPGGPRPPIIVVGVSDVVSVLGQGRPIEPIPVMDESIGVRVETPPAEQPFTPIIIGSPAPAISDAAAPAEAERARPTDAGIDLVPVMSVGQVRKPVARAAEPVAPPKSRAAAGLAPAASGDGGSADPSGRPDASSLAAEVVVSAAATSAIEDATVEVETTATEVAAQEEVAAAAEAVTAEREPARTPDVEAAAAVAEPASVAPAATGAPSVGRSATGRFTARGDVGVAATAVKASPAKTSRAKTSAAKASPAKTSPAKRPVATTRKAARPTAGPTGRPATRAASTADAAAKASPVRRAAARPVQARRPTAKAAPARRTAAESPSGALRQAKAAPGRRSAPRSASTRRPTAKAAPAPVRRSTTTRVIPAAHCPYCALPLDPAPTINRRCDRCRQKIVVRHVDGHAVYLTEGAVEVFEAERERIANLAGWTRQRDRWLTLAANAGASADRQSQLARARLTEQVVIAARALYMTAIDKTVRAAKRENRWDEASRIRREQAAAMYRVAGAPRPLPADLVAAFSDAVAAELRGIAEISRDAELVAANCCETCRADDGVIVRISQELRTPRLPHAGCPRGLCRCRWDLAARDRRTMSRYLRRRPGAGSRSGQGAQVEVG